MFKLPKSIIKSTGKAIYHDPEIKKIVTKHPKLSGFIKRRLTPDQKFGLYLTIGMLISIIFVYLFITVLESLIQQESLYQADSRIINLLQVLRTPAINKLMLFITYLGEGPIVILGAFFIAILFFIFKKKNYSIALIVSVLFGQIFVLVLKNIIQRPRPLPLNALIPESSFSFPSGHAFVALSFYGLVSYFLFRESKNKLQKTLSILLGILLILGIGFSRIYLGVHWPSDVLASYAAGAAWLTALITSLEIRRKFNHKPQDKTIKENSGNRGTFSPESPMDIDIPVDSVTKKRECIDRDYRTKGNQIIGNLCISERSGIINRNIHNKNKVKLLGLIFFIIWIIYLTYFFNTHFLLQTQKISADSIMLSESQVPEAFFTNFSRYSEDLTGVPIEPINLIFISSRKQLENTFEKANWLKTDNIHFKSIILSLNAVLFNQPYDRSPGIPSFWNTFPNDFAYGQPTEKHSILERHHIHFWKTPFLINNQEVWFSTAHFDNSITSRSRVIFAIHKINPAVDKEREKIKEDLLKTRQVRKIEEFQIVEPSAGTNSAGNMFFTDGKAEIIYLAE